MTYTHLTTNELVMIEAYYQEGTFQEISQKWFNEDTASPAVKGEE